MRPLHHVLSVLAIVAACAPSVATTGSSPEAVATPLGALPAQLSPGIPPDDRTRIAEAFRLADAIGDRIWPGWSSAPFSLLLVTPEREFLVRHPQPPGDFVRTGYDSLLRSDILARPRKFSPGLLATFPIEGVPTIVIGQASATGKRSTSWVLTALHEHFHQLQMSRPGYYKGVDALGLSRGDQTGMWMLNYPFPYGADSVQAMFSAMTLAVDSALGPEPRGDRQARLQALSQSRTRLRRALSDEDDRYLSFQMWQEGVARYTELQVARWAQEHYVPSADFAALADVSSFGSAADSIVADIRRGLRGNPLSHAGRVAFYPAGAATALLLDDVAPGWRSRYLESAFSLDGVTAGTDAGVRGGGTAP